MLGYWLIQIKQSNKQQKSYLKLCYGTVNCGCGVVFIWKIAFRRKRSKNQESGRCLNDIKDVFLWCNKDVLRFHSKSQTRLGKFSVKKKSSIKYCTVPSASRGDQWPDGSHGRGEEEFDAYCSRTLPSVHLSHTDPTSLGNQQAVQQPT